MFEPDQDSWTEIDSMPSYGSTGSKKRVKDGGDIVSDLNGSFYALKGNKTLEFWKYCYAPGAGIRSEKPREPAAVLTGSRFTVQPNPARSRVRLTLPRAPSVVVRIFDAGGKLLRSEEVIGRNALALDINGLSPGVYFVRADHAFGRETAKLVIE